MNTKLLANKTALLVLAGSVLGLLPATADLVPTAANGDIFLGFRAAGGQGGDSSYIVNLGPDTAFRNAAEGSTITLSAIGDIGSDLTATYGDDWKTRVDLHWGVFGVRNSASPGVYGSRERQPVGSATVPWAALDLAGRNSVASQVLSVLEGIGGYRGSTATGNSPVATLQSNFNGAASYNFQVATAGTTDFSSLSQWSSIEGDFGDGVAATALDLYRITSSSTTPVQNLGYFTISSGGLVTFTKPAAVSNVDTDGDGQLDSDEAVAGTNPNDGSDFFQVDQIQSPAGGAAVIKFQGVAGRTYQLQYSEALLGDWVVIDTLTGAPAGAAQFSDSDATRRGKPKGFYRIVVSQ